MTDTKQEQLDRSRPVLVIDGFATGDIGVIRSLGFYGVPVILLTSRHSSLCAASRYVTECREFPTPTAPDAVRVARLREIARTLPERPVIIATGDSTLDFLSRVREEISDVLDHDLAPPDILETCSKKQEFAVKAKELGLPIPITVAANNASDLARRIDELTFPAFVKPVDRADWARLPPGTVTGVKGQRVERKADLVRLFRELETHGAQRAVIQNLVPGPDNGHVSVHVYIDRTGRPLGVFSGRRTRVWPAHAGVGCYVQSEIVERPIRIALEALRGFRYTGFAIVQFKYDESNHQYVLLEINCRHSTWAELPSRSGCNFPVAAYTTMTDQSAPKLEQVEGKSWIDIKRDLQSLRTYLREGEWELWPYLWSLLSVRACAFFAFDDLGPFIEKATHRMR